jgi:hypothetical protein
MEKLIKFIVGKNAASLGRAIATFVGTLLLSTALFDPAGVPIDPALADAAGQVPAVTVDQVKDGLDVQETLNIILGTLLLWASRLVSWLRAKNKDGLAKWLGWLIGRSVPSLMRFLLTGASALVAYLTANPGVAPEWIKEQPLSWVFVSLVTFALARFNSATEDAKRNPVVAP